MKESRKEFIKQAHSNACSEWKEKIEKEFPELFKEDALVVGKYYKLTQDYINLKKDSIFEFLKYQTSFKTFAVVRHSVFDNSKTDYAAPHSNTLIPATDKEVEEALKKECFKKGYKEGVEVICLKDSFKSIIDKYDIDNPAWEIDVKGGFNLGNKTVMLNGKWAEIIKETITKEQAQEATRILVEYNNQ
jgi:hypothetical protein